MTTHVVLPDSQVKPGVPTDYLRWIGTYVVDHFAGMDDVKIIHLGDHWDMPSLSSYDRGTKSMEGRRVLADLKAGDDGLDVLDKPLQDYNATRRAYKEKQWHPEKHFLLGNHEDRISRAVEMDAQIDGLLSLDHVINKAKANGWDVHPFLQPVFLDGVGYAHYWANPMTGRPYGGTALSRLKTLAHSYTMGHQQTLDVAIRFVHGPNGETAQRALIAGAGYPGAEAYKGFQGNAHWRGILVCHEVKDGNYSLMEVTLSYLCLRYQGMPLTEYMKAQAKEAA